MGSGVFWTKEKKLMNPQNCSFAVNDTGHVIRHIYTFKWAKKRNHVSATTLIREATVSPLNMHDPPLAVHDAVLKILYWNCFFFPSI